LSPPAQLDGLGFHMPKNKTSKVTAGFAVSFTVLASAVMFLLAAKIVSFELGLLMLVALVALHLGFGILIAVYRLVGRLE
jgi:hypothetical protein